MRKSNRGTSRLSLVMMLSGFVLLAGCFDDGDKQDAGFSSAFGGTPTPRPNPTPTPTPNPSPTNQAPSIGGEAPATAGVGEEYSFKPTATDPDGDPITFSASGVPEWLTFDASTGRIYGRPAAGDVASYRGIRITVTDGRANASLRIARLDVVARAAQGAAGTATLEWEAPTINADGSPLNDLAGYNIRYGTSPGALDRVVELRNPGLTTYVVDGLSPSTWYFAISTVNSQGMESRSTGVVWTTIG